MREGQKRCSACATRISWIGILDSAALALFKGTVGLLTGSRALTMSALYSVHDVISGAAVIIGMKVSTKPPDRDHPYGHGNAEYVACAFTSIIILGATILLVAESVTGLVKGDHAPPHWAALLAAIVAVFANEIMHRFNACAARHTNSPALEAHGKHHRADAVASLAVVIAIVGGMFGYRFLDTMVAVFEAGHLIILSAEILYHGGGGLVDRAIDPDELAIIQRVVRDVPDVERIADVKTRQIGRSVWVDLYLCLPKDKTIDEVSLVAERIRQRLDKRIEYLGNVNVVYV